MYTISKAELEVNEKYFDDCIRCGSKVPPPYIVAVDVVRELALVVVVMSDKSVITKDIAYFVKSGNAHPDFKDIEVIDHGLTLRLGKYEVGSDTLLGRDMNKMFVVRQWDMFDGWLDIAGPVTEQEAKRIWNEHTGNGTHHVRYADGDYYAIFPSDTKMIFTPEYFNR